MGMVAVALSSDLRKKVTVHGLGPLDGGARSGSIRPAAVSATVRTECTDYMHGACAQRHSYLCTRKHRFRQLPPGSTSIPRAPAASGSCLRRSTDRDGRPQ
jgi:hypothetical protein